MDELKFKLNDNEYYYYFYDCYYFSLLVQSDICTRIFMWTKMIRFHLTRRNATKQQIAVGSVLLLICYYTSILLYQYF